MEADAALSHLGHYSKWHILNFVALGLTFQVPYSLNFASMIFLDYKPPFECTQQFDNHSHNNATCAMDSSGQHISCQSGWQFPNFTGVTTVTEWQLLGKKRNIVSTSQTILFAGYVFGIFVMCFPTDKFGRRFMCLYSTLGLGVVVTLSSWAPSYTIFTVSRFFMGFFCGGVKNGGFTLVNEIFPSHCRSFGGILIATFWSFSICLLSFLAYFIVNWRYLQLSLGVYCFLVLPLFRFIRESVLWDISKGRVEHAEETLRIAAKMNGVTFTEPILKRYELITVDNTAVKTVSHEDVLVKDNVLDLVRNKVMFLYLMSSIALGFGIAMIYYSFLLSTPVMHGNRFLNTFLGGLAEMPIYLIIYFISQRLGRKKPYQILLFTSALLSFIGVYFDLRRTAHPVASHYVMMLATIFSKMTLTACSALCNLYLSEIFPTTIRATSTGISSMFGKTATFFSVYSVRYMEKAPWLCLLTYGIILAFLAILFIYLPETHNRILPSTVKEACNMRKKFASKRNAEINHKNDLLH